ncbi:MAG: hypothetical protein EOO99_12005 [Pedobacter sp.]|nr:MAG: hypothetical protein EOO99_12005 [Pedobacter sp.]
MNIDPLRAQAAEPERVISPLTASQIQLYLQETEDKAGFISENYESNSNEFFSALLDCRKNIKNANPPARSIEIVFKTLQTIFFKSAPSNDNENKKFKEWLKQKSYKTFSWQDYCQAHAKMMLLSPSVIKNGNLNPTQENKDKVEQFMVCYQIIYCYYVFTERYIDEPDFQKFLAHDPFDYTRPHGWYAHQGYTSIGEALSALITIEEETDADKIKRAKTILKQFIKYFNNAYPKLHYPAQNQCESFKFSDLLIPYALYQECWTEAHSTKLIQPHSIEICIYYVQQNGLRLENIFETKAEDPTKNPKQIFPNSFSWYFYPSYKFMDVFDLMRHLTLWNYWMRMFQNYEHVQKWDKNDYIKHCNLFTFSESKVPKNGISIFELYWHGITLADPRASYRDIMTQSFQFFGDILNALSFTIVLHSQIIAYDKKWKEIKGPATNGQFKTKSKKDVHSAFQKELLTSMFKRYDELTEWLHQKLDERFSTNKDDYYAQSTNHSLPVWPCTYDPIFYLIRSLPRNEEYSNVRQVVMNEKVEGEFSIYTVELLKLQKSLSFSDLAQITGDNDDAVCDALFGMTALKPHSRPHSYARKITGDFQTPANSIFHKAIEKAVAKHPALGDFREAPKQSNYTCKTSYFFHFFFLTF